MMHDLASKACMDLHCHDEGIPGGLDLACIDGVGGFGTAIDTLAAIKTLVFDEKKLSWNELLGALECNWEGKEAIRQMCLNTPKYGNGIEWVEQIGKDIYRVVLDYVRRNPRPNGLPDHRSHHPDHLPRARRQDHLCHADRAPGGRVSFRRHFRRPTAWA